MLKKLVVLCLGTLLVLSLGTSFGQSSVPSQQHITFVEDVSTLQGVIATVDILHTVDAWRFSGQFWQYAVSREETVRVSAHRIAANTEALVSLLLDRDAHIYVTIPAEVRAAVSAGQNLFVNISSGREGTPLTALLNTSEEQVFSIDGSTVTLRVRPRFVFETWPEDAVPVGWGEELTFNALQLFAGNANARIEAFVPVPDPAFGSLVYSVFGRSNTPTRWFSGSTAVGGLGSDWRALQTDGRLHHSQILTRHGDLAPGATVAVINNATGAVRQLPSSDIRVGQMTLGSAGSSTLARGGAIGLRFTYPLRVTFYTDGVVPPPPPPTPTSSTGEIPEWRLSRFWSRVTEVSNPGSIVEAWSVLNIMSSDPNSHATPSLSPEGSVTFNLIPPDLSSIPWLRSRIRTLGAPIRFVGLNALMAGIHTYGDLLAIRENTMIDNIRTANWVAGNANLASLGIGSTIRGLVGRVTGSTRHSAVLDYYIANPNTYIYNRAVADDYEVWVSTAPPEGAGFWQLVCLCHTVPTAVSESRIPASYRVGLTFDRFSPSARVAPTYTAIDVHTNGLSTVAAQSPVSLFVNPEVFMLYSTQAGDNSGVFVAGDLLREVRPVSWHTVRYTARVVPNVHGSSLVTHPRAASLAASLGAPNAQAIPRGSAVTIGYNVTGTFVAKSFILDVGNAAARTAWNPGTTYNPAGINTSFMSQFGTFSGGLWNIAGDATSRLRVGEVIGRTMSNPVRLVNTSNTVVNHTLTVRGGRLVAVNGVTNFRGTIPAELMTAIDNMRLTTALGGASVLDVFAREHGAGATEAAFVSVGNSLRGTSDLAVGRGWYNEDSTVLVVREFIQEFNLPHAFFADRLQMSYPGIETPADPRLFFTRGTTGHTVLNMSFSTNRLDMNPYSTATGSRLQVFMEHDSYLGGRFGPRTIDYVVPNISVMDTVR